MSDEKEMSVKLKAVITDGAPQPVEEALYSGEFAATFLVEVVQKLLGVTDAISRPAEFYVQHPDISIYAGDGRFGVELRLTGVSRNGRTPKQFHEALKHLHEIAKTKIKLALEKCGSDSCIQLFTVIMLDGDIETSPGSGVYSNVLEHPAEWVTGTPQIGNPPTERSQGI